MNLALSGRLSKRNGTGPSQCPQLGQAYNNVNFGLHYLVDVPQNGEVVEFLSRIEPRDDPDLAVAEPINEDISLKYVWFTQHVAEEL